jgi:hypothetical protein
MIDGREISAPASEGSAMEAEQLEQAAKTHNSFPLDPGQRRPTGTGFRSAPGIRD